MVESQMQTTGGYTPDDMERTDFTLPKIGKEAYSDNTNAQGGGWGSK
jgi:hypothetical protein